MTDLLKLLDGSVDDVKAGLDGKGQDDLAALLAAEKDGKTRKGVIDAIEAAQALRADVPSADIPPATEIDPSGAPHQIVPDVDLDHPAVDADPRANTSVDQNRIDFNDPAREGVDVVSDELGMTKPADVEPAGASQ